MENNNDVTKTPVCSCCCTKHTDRSEAERKKLVNRLKRGADSGNHRDVGE